MSLKTEEPKIKIMPYLGYNQQQAFKFDLNANQAIIMNYFSFWLPHYGVSQMIEWKAYFWANIWKPLADMPTLQIKESTYRDNIRTLIKKEILDRKLVTEPWNKTRAFYRVTEKWMNEWTSIYPSDFNTLYNILEDKIAKATFNESEINKLTNLFSSYQESKKSKTLTTYNLEWVWWTPILEYLVREFKLSEEWEWATINVWKEINKDYIQKEIVDVILENWIDYWWIKKSLTLSWYKYKWVSYDVSDEIKWKILGNLKKMFQWLKDKKRPVKSWNWNIRTWFWKARI